MPRAPNPRWSKVRREEVLREVRVQSLDSFLDGVMMAVF